MLCNPHKYLSTCPNLELGGGALTYFSLSIVLWCSMCPLSLCTKFRLELIQETKTKQTKPKKQTKKQNKTKLKLPNLMG